MGKRAVSDPTLNRVIKGMMTPVVWKSPAEPSRRVVGTHEGRISNPAVRLRRDAKKLRTQAHQPEPGSSGFHKPCSSYGECSRHHRKHSLRLATRGSRR